MANSFLDFLQSMSIAMEADDITNQTSNEVRSAIGEAPSTQNEEADRKEEEDLEKVDDIFGTEAPKNDGPSGNPEQDKAEGAEELPAMDDNDNSSENPEETNNDENLTDGQDSDNPTEETFDNNSSNEDLIFTKKNRIRDNLIQLYTIVSGNIEIIVNSLTNINDKNTINMMNMILNHLRNCKSYIYKTLTQNLTSLEYDELLQRYITLKRVYDICIEMMERYFKKDKKK